MNVPIPSEATPRIEETALQIAGPGAEGEDLEIARRIAEAQLEVNRVREVRQRLIASWMADLGHQALLWQRPPLLSAVSYDEKLVAAISEGTSLLAALDRYERRALSRRKFGIRDFDAGRRPLSRN